MKRVVFFIVAIIGIGGIAMSTSYVMKADAQEDRTITVEVTWGSREFAMGEEACSLRGQVVITDAGNVVVGKVDLIDITTLYTDAPVYHGVETDGLCTVSERVELPDSTFYTVTMGDFYRWTFSAAEIEANGDALSIEMPR